MMENMQTGQRGGIFPLRSTTEQVQDASSQDTLNSKNVLSDLVPDDIYYMLQEHGLFDEKAIRDYHIRKTFKEFRQAMSTNHAIEKLQQLYPYLQFDTLRKIVYKVNGKKKK